MTTITIAGALTMTSTNGDASQLLTEAAEFVAALAQMGVLMGVEISLRPVVAGSTPEIPDNSVARQPEPQSTPPAPANPTPAAPAQPDDPLPWAQMSKAQKIAAVHGSGRAMTRAFGRRPTQKEWDAVKPHDYPAASGAAWTVGLGWKALCEQWTTGNT